MRHKVRQLKLGNWFDSEQIWLDADMVNKLKKLDIHDCRRKYN